MLRDSFDTTDASPAALRRAYERRLADVLRTAGIETVAAQSGVDTARLTALQNGEGTELTISEAAAILAVDDELPAADAIEAEARDILLLGMSIAVLDVEALASAIDDALDPKEIQQKVEGRAPMTLAEYALLHSHIERNR